LIDLDKNISVNIHTAPYPLDDVEPLDPIVPKTLVKKLQPSQTKPNSSVKSTIIASLNQYKALENNLTNVSDNKKSYKEIIKVLEGKLDNIKSNNIFIS
jgi:hypothetical protein